MPSHKKQLKMQPRATVATRVEWSLLLVAAFCALLAISPAVGAPLTASSLTGSSFTASSAPVSDAMLWWLGNQLSSQQSTPTTVYRALLPASLDPHEVAALLASFDHAASVSLDEPSSLCRLIHSDTTPTAFESDSTPQQISADYPPLAARYDATRRLMQYALSMPEAATRSGLRTNRYHE